MTTHSENEMHELRREIEKVSENVDRVSDSVDRSLSVMTENVNKLVGSVSELTTTYAVNEEVKRQQEKINSELKDEIKVNKDTLNGVVISRAYEEQSRNFILKNWPWLLVSLTVLTSGIGVLSTFAMKAIAG
tara:strand:- start:109 stop:504 length:396 start_codon:yes stop_codon:yes gene_type:complete